MLLHLKEYHKTERGKQLDFDNQQKGEHIGDCNINQRWREDDKC